MVMSLLDLSDFGGLMLRLLSSSNGPKRVVVTKLRRDTVSFGIAVRQLGS